MQHFPSKDMQRNIDNAAVPGLWRRLAAIFYDSWLVAAIWLLGVTVDTFVGAGSEGSHLVLQIFATVAHGLLRLVLDARRTDARDACMATEAARAVRAEVTWRQSLIRYVGAWLSLLALGLGYLWILIDRDGLAWHDRLSNTRLVMVRKS